MGVIDQFNRNTTELRERGTLPSTAPPKRFQPWGIGYTDTFDYHSLVKINQKGNMVADVVAIAAYLRSRWFVTVGKEWFHFNGCYFEQVDTEDLEAAIQKALDNVPGFDQRAIVNVKKNAISAWKDNSEYSDMATPSDFDSMPYEGWAIPFRNGIYNVVEDEMYPFTPYFFFDYMLDVDYEPMEGHPVEKIYEQIVPNADTRRVLFEAMGFTMFSPCMHPESIFAVIGGGGSGKTTLLQIMTDIIGVRFVTGLTPLDLSERFGPVALRGMKANFCTESARDPGDRRIVHADTLKKLSSGDLVSADEKYKAMQRFYNTAKLWFAANGMPDLGFNDSGVGRRLHIFPILDTDWVCDEAFELLYSDEGKSWLAFTALRAYVAFIQSGALTFEDSKQMLAYKSEFDMEDPFLVCFERRFETLEAENLRMCICDNGPIYMDEIYESYLDLLNSAEFKGAKLLTPTQFSIRMKTDFGITTYVRKVPRGDGTRVNRRELVRQNGPTRRLGQNRIEDSELAY